MKHLLRLFVSLVVPAFMLASVAANSAFAQDKAKDAKAAPAAMAKKGEPTVEVYLDNDQVRVFKVTFKPGDAAANVARPLRVIYPLKGGTLTLTHPDGKKEKSVWKAGEVQVRQASPPYIPKNEGKSDIVLHIVFVKEPKK